MVPVAVVGSHSVVFTLISAASVVVTRLRASGFVVVWGTCGGGLVGGGGGRTGGADRARRRRSAKAAAAFTRVSALFVLPVVLVPADPTDFVGDGDFDRSRRGGAGTCCCCCCCCWCFCVEGNSKRRPIAGVGGIRPFPKGVSGNKLGLVVVEFSTAAAEAITTPGMAAIAVLVLVPALLPLL